MYFWHPPLRITNVMPMRYVQSMKRREMLPAHKSLTHFRTLEQNYLSLLFFLKLSKLLVNRSYQSIDVITILKTELDSVTCLFSVLCIITSLGTTVIFFSRERDFYICGAPITIPHFSQNTFYPQTFLFKKTLLKYNTYTIK